MTQLLNNIHAVILCRWLWYSFLALEQRNMPKADAPDSGRGYTYSTDHQTN